jgi:hypothetical protein
MSSLKASGLSELLKEYGVDVSPKNIGRFTKNYGIKKDPSRPIESGFYLKPSEKQLEKIASQYEKNILKASGSTEAGKEAFKKREARARKLLTQGYSQTEADNILKKEFNMSMKSTLTKVANDLREEGVKIISGRESEIKTPASKFSKERRELQKTVSDPYKEKLISEAKRQAGYGNIDLAHRTSMQQNKKLGMEILSSNLGLDPQKVNREIIKPIENELSKVYEQQTKVVNKIKKEGSSLELKKELEALNKQVSEIVATTDGRLQGILVDEYNLKPKITGINYAKVFGAGVLPDKPVSQLTKEEIALAVKQIPGQMKSIEKLPKGLYAEVIPGQRTLGNYLTDIVSDVKVGKILSPTLKVLAPVGTAVGAYDVAQSYAEGKPLPETAGAFLGVDPIIEAIREESRLTPEASEIKKRIRTEELEGREYTSGLDVLPPSNIKPVTKSEIQKVASEEEQIRKQLEEERLATKEERGKVLDYFRERFSPFGEERIEMEEGGFVEFGDPETWKEKASQFINRPVYSKPIEKIKPSTFGKYSSQIAETRLGPEEPLSKYKSYSELEILGNISAKKPNYEIEEEYMYNVMPEYSPKEIVPKESRPVMPNQYNRAPSDGILELARGGRVKPKK